MSLPSTPPESGFEPVVPPCPKDKTPGPSTDSGIPPIPGPDAPFSGSLAADHERSGRSGLSESDGTPPGSVPPDPAENQTSGIGQAIRQTLSVVWVFLGSQTGFSLVFGLSGGFFLGLIAAMDTGLLAGPLWWLQRNLNTLLTIAAVTGSGLLAAWFGASRMKISLMQDLTNTKFDRKWLYRGTVMLYTASFVLGLLITLFNAITSRFGFGIEENALPSSYGFFANLLFFLCVAVAGPILEECIFRGVICKGLARFNKGFAVVFSALLFGLVHMNLYQAIPAFGMGLVLGFVYLRSESLLVPIFMHMFNNALSMIADYIPESSFMVVLLALLIVVMAILGAIEMVRQKKEIRAMLAGGCRAQAEWKIVLHSVSFWMIPVCFVGLQLLSAVLGYFMSWLLYHFVFF